MNKPAPTCRWDTVTIVGVGLIGGSIGMDLLGRGLARRVIGVGRRESSLKTARRVGAVSETTLDLARGAADAELVVVCTPVGRIVEDVRAAAEACRPGTLITDAGSTKELICRALAGSLPGGARFVGSHPLAGSEKNGPAAAVTGLLAGRVVVVTPTRTTKPDALHAIEQFWKSLGARVVRMSPRAHDRALAATSHLPHITAAALAAATPQGDLPLVAGGWLDSTRIAAGDPALWRQIFLANRGPVLTALARYEKVLASLRRAIERGQPAALERILKQAKRRRERAANESAGCGDDLAG